MPKLSLATVFAVLIFFCFNTNTLAQTCGFTSVAGGTLASPLAWTAGATWGGTAPSTSSPSSNVCIGNGVTASIVSISAPTFVNWSTAISINVKSGSTLVVNGDLSISDNVTVNVQVGGTLKITGGLYFVNAGSDARQLNNLGTTTVSGLVDIDGPGILANGSGTNTTADMTVGSTVTLRNSGGSALRNYANLTVTGAVSAANPVANSGTFNLNNGFTLTSSGSASLNNSGTFAVTGSMSVSNSVTNSGTLTVSVDYTQAGGSTTSTGTMNITGDVKATGGSFQLSPAASANSTMTISGSLIVNANENMKVGTGSTCSASTYYANLIVKTNVSLIGSGDIKVYSNGRLVVFGNIDGTTSSGTLVTVNCGGQAYVNGNINLGSGGGNTVTNSNGASAPTGTDSNPLIGLYVNGTVTSQYNPGNDSDPNTTVGTKSQMQSNDQTFYNYILSLPGSPLPVTLTYFKVKDVTSEGVTLEWQTVSELNFDHFNLMRSTDGKNFKKVAEIAGHGTTKETHTYTFTDKSPLSGKSYYQLQSVDFDLYTEDFHVISVNVESPKSAALYPNPVTDSNLNIELNFVPASTVYVSVLDFSGAEVTHSEIKAGEVTISLQASVKPGVYMVRLSSPEIAKIERVIVK